MLVIEEIKLYDTYLRNWQATTSKVLETINADIKTQFISFLSEVKLVYYTAEENRYTPVEGCTYGYTSNGQLYCGDPGNIIFIREFSAEYAPSAESKADIEEELTDYFIGLSGITESGYEWTIGVNRTEYDYLNTSQEFTDSIYDYFYGKGATDANGDLLTSTYQKWYWECETATYAECQQDQLDFIDLVDFVYGSGTAAYFEIGRAHV